MHISRRLAGFAAVGLTAVLALAACADDGEGGQDAVPSWDDCEGDIDGCNAGETQDGGQIVWAFEQQQASWNQQTATGNTFVLAQIVDRFLPSAGDFAPSGAWLWNLDLLAEEPQLTSEDPQTVVYQIRPEAKWSDGTDITADDFAWVWKHNAGPDGPCPDCDPASDGGYNQIESVEGTDNGKTVTVTLRPGEKFAEWQFLFTQMYPAHIAEAQGFDLDTPEGMKESSDYFGETLPTYSGGAFQVAEADLRQQIILERNPNYYGDPAPLEQITFRIVTEQDALVTAMSSEEIDGASPQPNPDMVQQVGAMPGVLSRVDTGFQWEHLDLNLENEWLSDVELRRAVFTAVDINNINERTFASFFPDVKQKTNHLFREEDTDYHEDIITGTGQGTGDADAALEILTAAGYELVDGTLTLDGEQVGPIRFVHTEGNQLRATTAQLVQQDLAEIGIEVTIETTADLGLTLSEGDFDVMIFAWVGSSAFQTSGQQFWHSEGGGNYGKCSNPEVDRLTTEALNQIDLAVVADLLNEAAAIVVGEACVLPIADKPVYAFVRDDYLNVRPNPTNSGSPYNAEEWGLAATAAAE
jgi:peptide/nickel transport system substrate-binding protein